MPLLPFTLPWSDFIDDPLHDTHVVQEAISRLVQQYKKPKIESLIRACATPAQDLEDALIQLYVERRLALAVGAQLDILGAIVGQPRLNFADDFYRLCIQTRILINRSSGGPEELYAIFALVLPAGVTQALTYLPPAAITLTFGGAALSYLLGALFAAFLRKARGGGIGGQVVWSTLDPSATFTLDGSSGQALDNGGLADASP